MSPLDFLIWVFLKSYVYVTRPEIVEDLQTSIRHDIHRIPPEIIDNVQNEYNNPLGYRQAANAAKFEHYFG